MFSVDLHLQKSFVLHIKLFLWISFNSSITNVQRCIITITMLCDTKPYYYSVVCKSLQNYNKYCQLKEINGTLHSCPFYSQYCTKLRNLALFFPVIHIQRNRFTLFTLHGIKNVLYAAAAASVAIRCRSIFNFVWLAKKKKTSTKQLSYRVFTWKILKRKYFTFYHLKNNNKQSNDMRGVSFVPSSPIPKRLKGHDIQLITSCLLPESFPNLIGHIIKGVAMMWVNGSILYLQ